MSLQKGDANPKSSFQEGRREWGEEKDIVPFRPRPRAGRVPGAETELAWVSEKKVAGHLEVD